MSEARETTFTPVEMEMSTGAIKVVTGPSGITEVGILLRDRSSEVMLETVC